jgi:hypothetical protein
MKIEDLQVGTTPRLVKKLRENEEEKARATYKGLNPPAEEKAPKAKGKLTTTKPGKHKSQQQLQEEQAARNQKQQEYLELRRGSPATRSQEPIRLPPKWDLSRIEEMEDGDIYQALRDDPEFAAAAKQFSKEQGRQESKLNSPKQSGAPNKRSSRSTTKKVPKHVRELMDSGVPVTQWVVLLVLLGAGLYQLRKTLVGPEKKTGSTSTITGRNKGRGGTDAKKGKQKKQKRKAETSNQKNNRGGKRVSKASPKPRPAAKSKQPEPEKAEPSTYSIEKKTKKKKKKVKSSNKEEKQQLHDVISTNISYQHGKGEQDNITLVALTPPIHADPSAVVEDDDASGWHAVTKSRKKSIPTTASSPESPNTQPSALVSAPQMVEIPATAAEVPQNDSHAEKENIAATDAGRTTGAKKKKKKKTSQLSPNVTDSTDDDAEFARKLQKEEEILAKTETDIGAEEAWEEVTSSKKKKGPI